MKWLFLALILQAGLAQAQSIEPLTIAETMQLPCVQAHDCMISAYINLEADAMWKRSPMVFRVNQDQLILLGSGVTPGEGKESLAIACVDSTPSQNCQFHQFVNFIRANEAYFIGPRFRVVPFKDMKGSQKATLSKIVESRTQSAIFKKEGWNWSSKPKSIGNRYYKFMAKLLEQPIGSSRSFIFSEYQQNLILDENIPRRNSGREVFEWKKMQLKGESAFQSLFGKYKAVPCSDWVRKTMDSPSAEHAIVGMTIEKNKLIEEFSDQKTEEVTTELYYHDVNDWLATDNTSVSESVLHKIGLEPQETDGGVSFIHGQHDLVFWHHRDHAIYIYTCLKKISQ